MQRTILVQGGARGIGRALVDLFHSRGDRVFATCREPASAEELSQVLEGRVFAMDLESEGSIASAIEAIALQTDRLHGVFVVAGLLHDGDLQPEKRIAHLDPAAMARVFAVNALGPALLAKHVVPLLCHEDGAFLASLSARVGSIGDNRLGGWYSYRASKAAQNQLMRTFALEMKRKARGLVVAMVHPGTVDTDLSEPFQRNVPAHKLFSVERAASQLVDVVEGLEPHQTGSFWAWDGTPIPW